MSWEDIETTLRRARRGDTYHRSTCFYARNALPWIWAEGKSRSEVEASHVNGLHACLHCDPLSFIPDQS